MLTHDFLGVATEIERDHNPAPEDIIELTVNEFRREVDAKLLGQRQILHSLLSWSKLASTTPSPRHPLPTTRSTTMITIYGCSTSPRLATLTAGCPHP
jgi:hypothetical protein